MIVFLHAFPLSPVMWQPLIEHLKYPSLAITLPGFGDKSLPPAAPSMSGLAREVWRELAEQNVDESELVLIGCSLGGYVIMELLRQGVRPEAIGLFDTKHTADGPDAVANRLRVAQTAEEKGVAPLVDALSGPLLSTKSSHLEGTLRDLVRSTDPSTIAWMQRAMAERPDSSDVLSGFEGPALIVVGEDDQLSPVSIATEMSRLVRSSKLEVIKDAGHLSPWEQPLQVASAIEQWLERAT